MTNRQCEPFAWMLVTTGVNCVGVGTAYMCGTWKECAVYQMKNGLRATTEIVYTG